MTAGVGLVIVSHSASIATGVVELAAQMAASTRIIAAGGTDDGGIGTSFDRVLAAIAEADPAGGGTAADGAAPRFSGGVVILCDLGSAVLTSETALDFLDDDQKARVRIADAPIVEGAVAAAVEAESGGDLESVLAAAEAAGFVYQRDESSVDPAGSTSDVVSSAEPSVDDGAVSATVVLRNKDGLHARPAAELVKLVGTFNAKVTVNGVDGKSLLRIMALGLSAGSDVEIRAEGVDAEAAVEAIRGLVESGFGE